MKRIILILILCIYCGSLSSQAKQILPESITKNTIKITAKRTGESGKNYFYSQNGEKCSTEQIVIEHYKNAGYEVLRAEHDFWKGMFTLCFLDEFYPQEHYKSINNKGIFYNMENFSIKKEDINKKCKLIKTSNLHDFINSQIKKHEQGAYIKDLDQWQIAGFKNPTEYFKSQIVQQFLAKIDNRTFYKIISKILKNKTENVSGTPDYIVWNNKEMIFIEVKRKNEKLSQKQIEWGEYLIKNKIPYKVLRVIW